MLETEVGRYFSLKIKEDTKNIHDLDAVLPVVSQVLDEIRLETGNTRTGLVSGKIRSKNDYLELKNRRFIQEQTQRIRVITRGITVINFGDIFGEKNELYRRVTENLSPEERGDALCGFCVDLVESEITDLFLLPGWEGSQGSVLERKAILRKNGVIYEGNGANDLIL